MTTRTSIVAGNWKMNKTLSESVSFANDLRSQMANDTHVAGVEIVVCPTFVALSGVAEALRGTAIHVGAQNVSQYEKGAYTSQIAANMLVDLVTYVIVGHSEARQYLGDTDEAVNAKARAALAAGLKPIIAVGESQTIREANQHASFVADQVRAALNGLSAGQMGDVVIAYEPIWAIGTGLNATKEDAQNMIGGTIRPLVRELYGEDVADALRIQYGGSVKPSNMAEYMAQPDIDGALVGGASLVLADFAALVQAAQQAKASTL